MFGNDEDFNGRREINSAFRFLIALLLSAVVSEHSRVYWNNDLNTSLNIRERR